MILLPRLTSRSSRSLAIMLSSGSTTASRRSPLSRFKPV